VGECSSSTGTLVSVFDFFFTTFHPMALYMHKHLLIPTNVIYIIVQSTV